MAGGGGGVDAYVGDVPERGVGRSADTDDLARTLTALWLGVDQLAAMRPGDEQGDDTHRLLHLLSRATERLTDLMGRLVGGPSTTPD